MKIAESDNEVERSDNITNESSFSIDLAGKAFQLLGNTVYKNKIGAVIRETSCNAFDSHIAAGTPLRPFDVHLPNIFEPWFSVRDYGIGLSDKDVRGLYTRYFSSTKSSSNEFIGAFGLGSKSPFAYTDSFSVVSTFDGIKRHYAIFTNEKGIPHITMLSEEETADSNGVEVQLQVLQADFDRFKSEAAIQLKHFHPRPNLNANDLEWDDRAPIISGKGWRVFDTKVSHGDVICIQGCVAYPLHTGSMSIQLRREVLHMVQNMSIEVDFEIGDLSAALSREELSYTTETSKNIIKRLDVVYKDLQEYFDKMVNAVTGTPWEKSMKTNDLLSQVPGLFSIFDPTHKHRAKEAKIIYADFPGASYTYKAHGQKRAKTFTGSIAKQELALMPGANVFVFVETKKIPFSWYLASIPEVNSRTEVLVIKPDTNDANDIIKSLGEPPFKTSKDIARPVAAPRGPRVKQAPVLPTIAVKVLTFDGKGGLTIADAYESLTSLPATGIWVRNSRHGIRYSRDPSSRSTVAFEKFQYIMQNANSLGLFDNCGFDKIYLIESHWLKDLENKKAGWFNIADFVKDKFKVFIDKAQNAYQMKANVESHRGYHAKNLVAHLNHFKNIGQLDNTNYLVNYLETYKEYAAFDAKKFSTVKDLNRYMGFIMTGSTYRDLYDFQRSSATNFVCLNKLLEQVKSKYPFLGTYIDSYNSSWDSKTIKHVIDYIRMVDMNEQQLTKSA